MIKKYHQWDSYTKTKPQRNTDGGFGRFQSCELINVG